MSDSGEQQFYPISHSADGKLNAYSHRCDVVSQMMNYAACLWRINVLSDPSIRTPADWAGCTEAKRTCRCPAANMREEEVLKGHSIYFRSREEVRKTWMPTSVWTPSKPTASKFDAIAQGGIKRGEIRPMVATGKGKSMFDAMGEGTDYAAAINAAASDPTPAPAAPKTVEPAVKVEPKPSAPKPAPSGELLLKSLPMEPGESPLAYARRLAAARQAAA